ncbi:helix-turn-helix domain-containing protein [Paenibacillus odorifer]|uniref:helix-turn-helix domain-containing protein n=1 Tax=Paenibacillus odorifer TaxID=189426 RepID=UPI0020BDFCE4|nr:helix-turn-helix domain-containing protein [Paenibacillus odorifer]
MPKRQKILLVEDLPDVCSPQICADFLGVSRNRIYELCQLSPEVNGIPSYTIGGSRKIDKSDLLLWKEAQRRFALQKFELAR